MSTNSFQQAEVDVHLSELIMRGTEMWVSRYSVEKKQQSLLWKSGSSKRLNGMYG
jgi:hypothetical protein